MLLFKDVLEYLDKIGKKSRTPEDAMRFGVLSLKIDEIFKSIEEKEFLKAAKKSKKLSRTATERILSKQSGFIPSSASSTSSLSSAPKALCICGNMNAEMMCSGCESQAYCTRECQLKHWKVHKQDCKLIQKEIAVEKLEKKYKKKKKELQHMENRKEKELEEIGELLDENLAKTKACTWTRRKPVV